MRLPATSVFIHHSVTPVTENIGKDMRSIEMVGLQRFGQFPYSYCIHPHDGEILEGCGVRRGAHTSQRNSTAFGISWIGNYEDRLPKAQQINATRWLIAHLIEQGHLRPDAEILGHRDVYATACPGKKLYTMLDMIREPWTPPQEVRPMHEPALTLEPIVADLACPTGGAWLLSTSGAIYAFGGAPYKGAANGQDYFMGRRAARLEPLADGYTIVATSGETYNYP